MIYKKVYILYIYEYIKRLLWKIVLCIKEMNLVIMFLRFQRTYELLEKLFDKRSELKYLINFRKRNQTRFYD